MNANRLLYLIPIIIPVLVWFVIRFVIPGLLGWLAISKPEVLYKLRDSFWSRGKKRKIPEVSSEEDTGAP